MNVNSIYLIICLNIFSIFFGTCQTTKVNKTNSMDIKPDIFKNVPLNTSEENPCSPPEIDSTGIAIQAPAEVTIAVNDANKAIPICGLYMVELLALKKNNLPLKLNVYHIESDFKFSGFMIEKEPHLQAPEPKPQFQVDEPEPDLSGTVIGSYFNPNLLKYVKFPLLPGFYEVHAEYADLASNKVTIKVVIKN